MKVHLNKICFVISDKNKGPRQAKSSSSKSNQADDNYFRDDDGPSNLNDRQKPRSSHPPHLKGREIGSIFILY